MKALHSVAFILVIVGGLNWLLIGLLDWGIESVLGMGLSKVVYILVGLSAVYLIISHKKDCRQCVGGSSSMPMNGSM